MESPPQAGSRPQQKKYVVAGSRGLGGAQILFAGLLLTFGIVGMVIQTFVFYAGTPIWTGLMYLVTGILGVVSSHRNTKCVLIGLLVMSCLSVLMTFCGIATAAIAIEGEHWSTWPGPVDCHYDWSINENSCTGIDKARYTIDAANLVFALVELGLSLATIAICCYTLCNGCCGEGGVSCCSNGNTGDSYQTMHGVGRNGRLVPLQNFANINYAPAHSAHAPSYVISSPIPPQHGGGQQGMAAGTVDQAMAQAHAQQQQQQQQKNEQQQGAAPDAHAQSGYVSPPPGYNQA
ncbi:membrane-spanning 4-domains subfamily A member 6B-like [Branchiostoma lanceolatum]|uniref:membrane-spanning 4-domains subfamily A member 6B-like n=1 Tax=Branchiostoma lanceolatum TaxID=7740 RepID=UPI003453311E